MKRSIQDLTIVVITGTRPEIIKIYPVIRLFESKRINYKFIHTGQHYDHDLTTKFTQGFAISPDYNIKLGSVMDSVDQISEIMSRLNVVLKKLKPSAMLLVGDTNSVAASALVAVKSNIPIAHIEAGLRSYDWKLPEEHNRKMVDHVSDILFAPTEEAASNMRNEGVRGEIRVVGNTVIDAVRLCLNIHDNNMGNSNLFRDSGKNNKDFILLTLHRAENVDDQNFLKHTIIGLSKSNQQIIFPMHPRTIKRIREFRLSKLIGKNIRIIRPLSYFEFLTLLQRSKFIITDSGGVQEEITAPEINKHALILRASTERPESLKTGHAILWKGRYDWRALSEFIRKISFKQDKIKTKCPYGNGNAAVKIVKIVEDMIKNTDRRKVNYLKSKLPRKVGTLS